MDEKPVVFILRGDDTHGIEVYIQALYARMGDSGMAELNTTRLDGRSASEEEIRTAANTLPFLSERRLVIVHNPLAKVAGGKAGQAGQARFTAMLDGLPQTTALVLVVDDSFGWNGKKKRMDWNTLHQEHWLAVWAGSAGKRVKVQDFMLPQPAEMPGWILKVARERGGQFTPGAAQALAGLIGSDTQLASREIEKLLEYVDYQRAVEPEDVNECTASVNLVSIFDMTDAMAVGDASKAARLLRALLEEQDAISIFGMVVSHFRALLLAREALDEGGREAEVQAATGRPVTIARKLMEQARRFSITGLEGVYHRLLEMDEAMKNSQLSGDLALETLIMELARNL